MNSQLTRRELFSLFGRAFQRQDEHAATPASDAGSRVAIIQGRHCLALSSFCATCVERCPVEGAMQVSNGMPMVVPDVCTGCGKCFEVCPAPTNAVLMLPRRIRQRAQLHANSI